MASNETIWDECEDEDSDKSCSEFSDSDSESVSDSGSGSGSGSDAGAGSGRHTSKPKVCDYYNDGHCRFGKKCRNLHVCKYFLKGSCRYGAGCRLKHNQSSPDRGNRHQTEQQGRRSHGKQRRRSSSSSSVDSDEDDGRPYRWQLDLGKGWEDVCHDDILEAQYSRPNTKGIRIFNTPAGAISIDFTKMRVLKKTNIRVRRKGSPQTEWLWYYRGDHGWYQYGEKGSKGKTSPIQSSKLEREYQKNPRGSVQFTIDSTTYEISFKGMHQKNVSTGHRRRIRRRPKYEPCQTGVCTGITKNIKNMMSKKTPLWQFEGRGGNWHTYNKKYGCSISSADIENSHQLGQNTLKFTVNRDSYILDFSSMTQVNQQTNGIRNIRRVNQ